MMEKDPAPRPCRAREVVEPEQNQPRTAKMPGLLSPRPGGRGSYRTSGQEPGKLRGHPGSARAVVRRPAFVLPFLGILAWLRAAAVYHQQFFEYASSGTYPIYNLCSTLYRLYLFCVVYHVRRALLRALEGARCRLDAGLAAGARARLAAGPGPGGGRLRGGDEMAHPGRGPLHHHCPAGGRGLGPGGGQDYFEHYLPYFREVADTQGLWPNAVWYHYLLGATPLLGTESFSF